MTETLTPDDDGKEVLTPDGRVVGWIECTSDGTVLVHPCPEFIANYGSLLTSCWDTNDCFRLDESAVTAVEEKAVRIQAQ